MPEHWKVFPLKYRTRCASGDQIPVGDVSKTPRAEQGREIPVIGGNGRMGYAAVGNVNVPTIAIGRVGALCGNVHIVESPAWITDNALMLRVDERVLELRYVAEALRIRNLNELANQSAQPLITGTQLRAERLPVPPLSEQASIVSFVSQRSSRMTKTVAGVKRKVELIRELRTRLIADVVTGKLDVRETVAGIPDLDPLVAEDAREDTMELDVERRGPHP